MWWRQPTTGISQGVTIYIYRLCEGKLTANTTKVAKAKPYTNKASTHDSQAMVKQFILTQIKWELKDVLQLRKKSNMT